MLPILIVIPHYGSNDPLFRLLSSLGISSPDLALLATERQLCASFAHGQVCIINNNLSNRGFTAACNEGIQYGLDNGFSAVWLLNNDTVVPDLAAAVAAFDAELSVNQRTGVVGCKMLSLADPDFIHHGGTKEAFPGGVHKVGWVSRGEYATRSEEKWVTGASMVLSVQCLRATGLLDENFFNYASDSDYCYRASAAGYDVVYLPVPILHAIGQSAHPSPEQFEILKKDSLYFERKWIRADGY